MSSAKIILFGIVSLSLSWGRVRDVSRGALRGVVNAPNIRLVRG